MEFQDTRPVAHPENRDEPVVSPQAVPAADSVQSSPLPGLGLLGALSVALAACGGGGGGSGGGSTGGGTTPTPVNYNYAPADAARFLLQAQFAFKDSDLAALNAKGYDGWLTAQFDTPANQTGVAWMNAQGHNIPTSDGNYFGSSPGDFMIWHALMTDTDQLRKRCALAVSEMMVASLNPFGGWWPSYVIAGYWDTLNAHVFGNFRTLLEQITLTPAVGAFLNTAGNLKEDPATGREPDENYAREVMQLFTIGLYELNIDGTPKTDLLGNKKETYTQSDISNLARVFTGYDWDWSKVTWTNVSWLDYDVPSTEFATSPMAFNADNHSMLEVKFLGVTIPANTPGPDALKIALDTLFNHPNVGPFFGRQMIQRLVTSNPSPAYVSRVAAKFNDNGSGVRGDLKAVWRAILLDDEARTLPTNNTAGKLREPMIRLAQFARTFDVYSTNGKWEIYDLSGSGWGIGQSPLRSPSVFNFFRPGYVPPQTAIAANGDVAPEFQLHNETTVAGFINFFTSVMQDGYGDVKPDYTAMMPNISNSQALLDWMNLHLSANQVSPATIALIKAAIDVHPIDASSTDFNKRDRICNCILLLMSCPEYLIQK
ncbi:DUF1800 domain-containing protein [Asticcacaulis taihuensis]|uniref:Uncharacterized conserved protein, DUF1800 family n=1 Tax=Asticcacaulis taihuensis TaxID=260084 RepID=A0A1G4QL40_9CAUL|nr:DUF1800 domain-containing protein [Asticcacaulis taihuensis]SCW45177.1 Uncharacterized conserved protein, DUF1800 family [Asticcacaulis taihuensis]